MTLTYPLINRARQILWMVMCEEKAVMLKCLIEGDETIPAGRIARGGGPDQALVPAGAAAVADLKLPAW